MIINLKSALLHVDEACPRTFIKSSRLMQCLTIEVDTFYDKRGENEREREGLGEIHLLIYFLMFHSLMLS